jgi:sulfate permease, SulP family
VVTAVASIFGSSSHLVNGPTSAISLLVFSSLGFIDPENRTGVFEALFLLGVLVGIIQILIAVLRLGDLTRYISESVIIGFMAAAAFLLAVGQIANALGVKFKGTASQPVLEQLWVTLVHGDPINYRAVLLSGVVVVLAIGLRRLVQRFRWPQIDLLLVLVVAALIAHVAGWSKAGAGGKTAVSLAAKVPQSLPSFHIPVVQGHTDTLAPLAQGALAIAFIGIIEALSIAKAIAHQTQQNIDYNRQILAEGLANLVGGFFQSVPGSGSLSRSAINFQAGAATRFSGIVSAATVAVALLLFAPLVHYVPQAALAGLLLVTAVRLVDFRRLVSTVRASRYDAGLVVVTAVTGVAIDLDKAVLLGVALSILLFVPRAAKLTATELIITPERVVRDRLPSDDVDPAIVIYDLEGELFFGAAPELDSYLDTLRDRIRSGGVTFVVLRLKRVRHPDAVCIERLAEFLREEKGLGVRILLAGVRPDTLTILRNVGFERWFPTEQVFPEEDQEYSATLKAVRYAHSQLALVTAGAPGPSDGIGSSDPPAYYLV